MSVTDAPNRDQAANWNDASGKTWAELQEMLDRLLAPFEARLIAEAAPEAPDARVLDIGCGAGATTLAMARRLGPQGLALGVDISGPLVAAARARAQAEGLANAAFVEADAQMFPFDAQDFDTVISRFGVMFFDDPEAAFANIRRALRPGGRLTFVAWRSPSENPFMIAGAMAAAPFLPEMKPPSPNAPGQFAFADGERVKRILTAAGWQGVEVAPLDLPGEVPEADLMTYVTRLGPAGMALRDADEATRAKVREALRKAFDPYLQNGAARFTSACWLVKAHA